MTTPPAFDALALAYDERFTESVLGRMLRDRVWRWLDRAFPPGTRVLELNCGTGEDAVHLARRGVRVLATDAAPAMLEVARDKVERARLEALIDVRQIALERLSDLGAGGDAPFDGAFSNFGGLNCVADSGGVARALAGLVKPGARLVLCVMGPLVPWEWGWFLARWDLRSAVRRLAPNGVTWRGITVRYPSVRSVRRAFAPAFIARRVGGLGVLVPPTYAEAWARRHPRLVRGLDRWERRIEAWPVVSRLGDHFLMELERR